MYRFIAPNNTNKNEMGKGLVVTPFWAKKNKNETFLILLIPENSKMIIIGPA